MVVCTLCGGRHRKADCGKKVTLNRTEAANLLQAVRHKVGSASGDLADAPWTVWGGVRKRRRLFGGTVNCILHLWEELTCMGPAAPEFGPGAQRYQCERCHSDFTRRPGAPRFAGELAEAVAVAVVEETAETMLTPLGRVLLAQAEAHLRILYLVQAGAALSEVLRARPQGLRGETTQATLGRLAARVLLDKVVARKGTAPVDLLVALADLLDEPAGPR